MVDNTRLLVENRELKERLAALEREVLYLRTHPTIVQGMKGETLVCALVGGELSAYAAKHDVCVDETVTIEVKFSKLRSPYAGSTTRRWSWSKPLGWKDKGKDCDFLLLIGEKDSRFDAQYLDDDSPYVFFLVPYSLVQEILSKGELIGSQVQINTNLATAKSVASRALKKYMVSEKTITETLSSSAMQAAPTTSNSRGGDGPFTEAS